MQLWRAGVLALSLACLASGRAYAVPTAPTPPTPPPSPAVIAAARAEGDALLKDASAEDLFDNETGQDGRTAAIVLRHRASGFRCIFNPGAKLNKVFVFGALTRGDDVGCRTQTRAEVFNLYIYRAPQMTNADLLANAAREIKQELPGAQASAPQSPSASTVAPPAGLSLPDNVTSDFASATAGAHVVIGKVGDWAVQARFEDGPKIGERAAMLDRIWTAIVLEGQRHAQFAGSPPAASSAAPHAMAKLTPEQARAEADRLIADAHAEGVFENVTKGDTPEVRHRLSGFVCGFEPGQPDNAIRILPRQPRGTDVACDTREVFGIMSFFVTLMPPGATVQDAFKLCLVDIVHSHPGVALAKGNFPTINAKPGPGAPPPPPRLTARLTYTDAGRKVFSRVSVAMVNGWMIEQRLTAPMDDKVVAADMLGEMLITLSVNRMAADAPARPPGPARTAT